MNLNELRQAVATGADLSPAEAERAVTAALDAISGALAKREKVSLSGFGIFETRERSARTGRNPQTGAEIEIAATVVPAFKPATALKRAVSEA